MNSQLYRSTSVRSAYKIPFVFWFDLRTYSDYFPHNISLSVFMTEAERAYRGTDWALNATVLHRVAVARF